MLACTLSAWPGVATGVALGVAGLSALWRLSLLSCLCLWPGLVCRCCARNSAWNLLKLCTLSLLSCMSILPTLTLHSAVVHCLHIQRASIMIGISVCLGGGCKIHAEMDRDWSSSLPCLTLIMAACLCYTLVLSPDISVCNKKLGDRNLDESNEQEGMIPQPQRHTFTSKSIRH